MAENSAFGLSFDKTFEYFQFGYVNVGTSIVQIVDEDIILSDGVQRGILMKSVGANTKTIFFSVLPNVTTGNIEGSGFPMDPGEAWFMPIADPKRIWAVAGGADQHVKFMIF